MEIFYLGQACFKIKSKEVTVVIDPPNPPLAEEADVICLTQDSPASLSKSDTAGNFIINGPGEYEVKEVAIFGIPAQENTIYSLEIEDFRIVHLGSTTQKLNNEQLSELEGADILMVSVGAIEIVNQLTPLIVIPMLYSDSGSVEKFFEKIEAEAPEAVDKLKLKSRADLPEETEVKLLNC